MNILAYYASTLAICTALLAAPLLLGSFVVLQRVGGLAQGLWLGLLCLLLLGALAAGALGLFLVVVPVPTPAP